MNILTLIIAFLAVTVLTGTDQLIKYWAVENLQGQPSKEFIKVGKTKILNMTYLENDGAVFGSFSGMRWVLLGVTSVLIIFCVYYLIKHKKEILTVISTTLIISGGLGNIIDRLFRSGLVVDYLDIQIFDFAIFNFADCCVVIGVILLLIQILFFDKSESKKDRSETVQIDE